MALPPRCLVEDLDAPRPRLDDDTRHHLGRVLRLRAGDAIELVDGRGGLRQAVWTGAAEPELGPPVRVSPAPARPIVLAVAAPRLPRLEWLVEKATELDVAALLLLSTRRGEREPGEARLARLARKADMALLQCRRLHRLRIEAAAPLDRVLEARAPDSAVWLGAPGGAPGPPAALHAGVLVLVGPEGGFTEDEETAARAAGAVDVHLGATVLRVETAAVALAAVAAAAASRDR